MPYRVRLVEPLRFNPTGYAREVLAYAPGEHEVPDEVGAFLFKNPALGEVIEALDEAGAGDDSFDVLEGSISDLEAAIAESDDRDYLFDLVRTEVAGRNRKGALFAIESRLNAIDDARADELDDEGGDE